MSNTIATPTVPQYRFTDSIRAFVEFIDRVPLPESVTFTIDSNVPRLNLFAFHGETADEDAHAVLAALLNDHPLPIREVNAAGNVINLPQMFGFDTVRLFVSPTFGWDDPDDVPDLETLFAEQEVAES